MAEWDEDWQRHTAERRSRHDPLKRRAPGRSHSQSERRSRQNGRVHRRPRLNLRQPRPARPIFGTLAWARSGRPPPQSRPRAPSWILWPCVHPIRLSRRQRHPADPTWGSGWLIWSPHSRLRRTSASASRWSRHPRVGRVRRGHSEVARWFGDDIADRHDSFGVDRAGLPMMAYSLRRVGVGPRSSATFAWSHRTRGGRDADG